MADDKTPKQPSARVATRIDPIKEGLSREQIHFIRQVELEQWKKKTQQLRTRNVVTGLAIGALVLGICCRATFSLSGGFLVLHQPDSVSVGTGDGRCCCPNGYTFYSVSQERIMDEMDEEAKRARQQGPKTGAN